MSVEEKKALGRRYFRMQDGEESGVVDQVVSRDYIAHMPSSDEDLIGCDAVKQRMAEERTGFPDMRHDIEDMVAEGDKVAARVTFRATHTGDLDGIAPTGKQVVVSITCIHRVNRGKIVESWFDYDALGMMQQLGMELSPKD